MTSYAFLRPAPAAVEAAIAEHERLTADHAAAASEWHEATSNAAKSRAAYLDNAALTAALASDGPEPGERAETERAARARRAERRRDALAPLITDAAADVIAAVADAAPEWLARIEDERAERRERVRTVLVTLSGELAGLDAANLRDRTIDAVSKGLSGVAFTRATKPVSPTVRVVGMDGPPARVTSDRLIAALAEYGAEPVEVAPAHVAQPLVTTNW